MKYLKLIEGINDWINDNRKNNDIPYKFNKKSEDNFSLDGYTLWLDLYGMMNRIKEINVDEVERKINQHQDIVTGLFQEKDYPRRIANKTIIRVWEMSATYLTFQCIGALNVINKKPKYEIKFIQNLNNKNMMNGYLDNMPWRNSPWGAGGWVDAISTMIRSNINSEYSEYKKARVTLNKWIADNQNIDGMWGEKINSRQIINGAYHLARGTYFAEKNKYPKSEKALRFMIDEYKNQYENDEDACDEMDYCYLFSKLIMQNKNYLNENKIIRTIIKEKINKLLKRQNADGGFSFYKDGSQDIHNYNKIGKKEYGISDIQGTVFLFNSIKIMSELTKENELKEIKVSYTHG